MTRKARGFTACLVAVFVVATCGILFAHPGPAAAESCGQSHVWAPAKPASEPVASLSATATPRGLVPLLGPDTSIWIGVQAQSGPRPTEFFAEPSAPRAPPLA